MILVHGFLTDRIHQHRVHTIDEPGRIFELFGFAKMFEGCWRQFRRRRLREKAKETDLRMKIYMLGFTCCAIAEAACWFIGAAWASQIVQLIIRFVYGMLMACVMLYSESDSLLPIEE